MFDIPVGDDIGKVLWHLPIYFVFCADKLGLITENQMFIVKHTTWYTQLERGSVYTADFISYPHDEHTVHRGIVEKWLYDLTHERGRNPNVMMGFLMENASNGNIVPNAKMFRCGIMADAFEDYYDAYYLIEDLFPKYELYDILCTEENMIRQSIRVQIPMIDVIHNEIDERMTSGLHIVDDIGSWMDRLRTVSRYAVPNAKNPYRRLTNTSNRVSAFLKDLTAYNMYDDLMARYGDSVHTKPI